MKRTAWVAVVGSVVAIASVPVIAQLGGAGKGGGPRAARVTTVGAFGGGVESEIERSVQLEMEGGQRLEGTISLRALIVNSDIGQYAIRADKIKMIRFLKPAGEENENARPARVRRDRDGNLFVQDPTSPTGRAAIARGKVITTSDREIIGDIHIPTDFALELDFGTLTLAPDKLRSITLLPPGPGAAPKARPAPDRSPPPKASPTPKKADARDPRCETTRLACPSTHIRRSS